MKISSNCTLAAATLSAIYRTYDETNLQPNHRLEDFLSHNGILLTMCMRFGGLLPWLECSLGKKDTKISASWIQQNKTRGFRVIGDWIDHGPPVGLVLQPETMNIRCLFPADAGTDKRDNEGCGPLSKDAYYGSKGYDHAKHWWTKKFWREEVIQIKNAICGNTSNWETCDCDNLVPKNNATLGSGIVIGQVPTTAMDDSWNYWSLSQYTIDQWSHIMGFPVCNISKVSPSPPDFDQTGNWLLDSSNHSWSPQQWPQVIQRMEDALDEHPDMAVWNEIVLDIPSRFYEDAVQAVFYIKGEGGIVKERIAREIAKREAKRLNKPFLSVDVNSLNQDIDLFQCAASESDMDQAREIVTDNILMDTNETLQLRRSK